MAATLIDGKALALEVRAQVAEDVRTFGQPVCLATILVGDDPASHVYVGSKHKASHEAGIDSRDRRFPADTPESEILDLIAELNADDAVDGILVQLPLPEHMDESRCCCRRPGEGRRRLPLRSTRGGSTSASPISLPRRRRE